jgi:hypothetical protein
MNGDRGEVVSGSHSRAISARFQRVGGDPEILSLPSA